MTKKTFLKYIFSSIKNDISRLISIFVIVVLGLGFLVGLKSTSPDLQETMDKYFNDNNFMDVYIQSTIGFSEDDAANLKNQLSGASQVKGYYQIDQFSYINDEKSETRLIYRSFNDSDIDKITLVEGRLPLDANEVLMLDNSSETISHDLGTKLSFENSEGETETYTVCGLVDDPFYISKNGDVTTIGSGVLDAVFYFDESFYEPHEDLTIIKIRYSGARKFNTFSDDYKNYIDEKVDEIEVLSSTFLENRKAEIKEQIKSEIVDTIYSQYEEKIMSNDSLTDEQKESMLESFKSFLESDLFSSMINSQVDQQYETLFGSIDPVWYVLTREQNQSAYMFEEDSTKVDAISTVFPVFFFVIALLVSITSVERIINKDRAQMGTLKSLGYSKGLIYTKYLIYGLLTTILGSFVAILFGLFVLPTILGSIYATIYNIGPMVYTGDPISISLYTFLMIALILLTITIIAFASLRDNVSSLLIGKAPLPGKKIWLEHIPFIWKHLKFNTKSMLRNVFRFKKNLIMMLIGIGGCTGLLLTSFGIKDSLSVINNDQYTTILKYDFVAKLTPEGMEEENPFSDVLNSSQVYYYEGQALGSKTNIDMALISSNSIPDYVGLDDPDSFDSSSFVITQQIAKELGLDIGDNIIISLDDLNNSLTQIKITGITQNYIGNYVYCGEDVIKNYFPTLTKNGYIVDTGLSDEEVNDYIDDMLENTAITSINSSQNTRLVYESVLSNLDTLVAIIVLLSGALIAVVIYNLTDIMVSERVKEIATLRVNGYYRYEALLYIFREIFFMSIIGVAIGIGVGVLLHSYVVNGISSMGLTFGMSIAWPSYIYTILLAFGFVLLVCILFFPKINKIKMAEALKSVE